MASTWGNNKWGANSWASDVVSASVTGQAINTGIGSLAAFNNDLLSMFSKPTEEIEE